MNELPLCIDHPQNTEHVNLTACSSILSRFLIISLDKGDIFSIACNLLTGFDANWKKFCNLVYDWLKEMHLVISKLANTVFRMLSSEIKYSKRYAESDNEKH